MGELRENRVEGNETHFLSPDSIAVASSEVRLEPIPGQQEIFHGGFCFAVKCYLIGRGPKPEAVRNLQ